MNLKFIRYILIIVGILFFFLAFKSFSNDVGGVSFENLPNIILNFANVQLDILLFFAIFGYIFFTLGINWTKIFHQLSKISLGFAVIAVTFIIISYPINSNSQEIVDSIQPTMDYILADSVDTMLGQYLDPYEGTIDVIISNTSYAKRYYVNNLTLSDANYLASQIGFSLLSDEEKLILAKMLITTIYEDIENNNPELKNIPIPLDQVNQMFASQMDLSIISEIDVSVIENMVPINSNAYIVVLLSQGLETKRIHPSNMKKMNVELIWTQLNLSENTSFNSKKNTLEMVFSVAANQIEDSTPGAQVTIPIDMMKHYIPQDVIYMLSSEIMSDNISQRVESVQDIRQYCRKNNLEEGVACSSIMITEYNNLMSMLSGEIQDIEIEEALSMTGFSQQGIEEDLMLNVSRIGTLEQVQTEIESMTDYVPLLLFVAIILFVLSGGFLFIDHKINKKEINFLNILKILLKMNMLSYIPTYIFLLIIWYVINADILLDFLDTLIRSMPVGQNLDIMMISNLPIYQVLISINSQILMLASIYLFLSIVIYIVLYFVFVLVVTKLVQTDPKKAHADNENEVKIKQKSSNSNTNSNEEESKNYIEKYKQQYSKEALKKALIKAEIPVEEVEKYIEKYY